MRRSRPLTTSSRLSAAAKDRSRSICIRVTSSIRLGRMIAARVGGGTPWSRLSADTYLPCAGEALPSCASRAGSSSAFGVAAGLAVEQPPLRIPHKCSARSPGRGIAYATRLRDLYSRKQTDRRSERREVPHAQTSDRRPRRGIGRCLASTAVAVHARAGSGDVLRESSNRASEPRQNRPRSARADMDRTEGP